MKRLTKLIALFLLVLVLAGCEANTKDIDNGNSVDEILNEQTGGADSSSVYPSQTPDTKADDAPPETESEKEPDTPETSPGQETGGVDYDLTAMNSDMVYATVYQMMVDPDTYIGKTIRMEGLYYAGYYEPTAQYYHYCMIQDALACCAQGMEFVLGDGNSQYPEDNTEVIVQGTFETYQEDGDPNLYCRLDHSSLELVGDSK